MCHITTKPIYFTFFHSEFHAPDHFPAHCMIIIIKVYNVCPIVIISKIHLLRYVYKIQDWLRSIYDPILYDCSPIDNHFKTPFMASFNELLKIAECSIFGINSGII